jgi:hypothetical protein
MTDPNYTAICLLVDRSGSMQRIRQSAEDAINEFILGQATAAVQHLDHRTIRLAVFDNEYQLIHSSRPAGECPRFFLSPRYSTALLDAMGKTITEFGAELAMLPAEQRPGTVIVAIMTDGLENASYHYKYDQIAAMVKHQQDVYQWQVLYLGANQDAIEVAARLGIDRDHAITYDANDIGTRSVVGSVSGYVATASAGGPAAFTDDDRKTAAEQQQ